MTNMSYVSPSIAVGDILGTTMTLNDCAICDNHPAHELRVEGHLGSGVYGTVFVTRDCNYPEQQYAIKAFCIEDDDHYEANIEPLWREVMALNHAASHSNVVNFHGVIKDIDNYIFFVFDFCPGDLQNALVDHCKNFYRQDRRITNLTLQLLGALIFCHKGGFYHHDLKPDNILISADHTTLYLADFGLATDDRCSSVNAAYYNPYQSPGAFC
jgi:serine/threonine protein kinase